MFDLFYILDSIKDFRLSFNTCIDIELVNGHQTSVSSYIEISVSSY